MSQEFESGEDSHELDDFQRRLRGFKPAAAENAEELFYQAGWEACMLNNSDVKKSSSSRRWGSFSRGLLVGLAASVLVALCLPMTSWFGNQQQDIANIENPIKPKSDKSPKDSLNETDQSKTLIADQEKVTEPLRDVFDSQQLLVLQQSGETIGQWLSLEWMKNDLTEVRSDNAPHETLLNKAFDRKWMGLVNVASEAQGQHGFAEEFTSVRPSLSSRDVNRVLEFF